MPRNREITWPVSRAKTPCAGIRALRLTPPSALPAPGMTLTLPFEADMRAGRVSCCIMHASDVARIEKRQHTAVLQLQNCFAGTVVACPAALVPLVPLEPLQLAPSIYGSRPGVSSRSDWEPDERGPANEHPVRIRLPASRTVAHRLVFSPR